MERFYVFGNSEDSLNIFTDNAGGRFRVYFPNPYVLDGTWECALLEGMCLITNQTKIICLAYIKYAKLSLVEI